MSELTWPAPDDNPSGRKIEYHAWFRNREAWRVPYHSLKNALYEKSGAIELFHENVPYFRDRNYGKCTLFAVAYKDSEAVLCMIDPDWVYLIHRNRLGEDGLKAANRMRQACDDGTTPRMSVEEYRRSKGGPAVRRHPTRSADPLLRQKIEEAAIRVTTAHFEALHYQICSRESDNLGWDLDAARPGSELKLEVKGLSGDQICVELTPNEYEKMRTYRDDYRICVVTRALSMPELFIYAYHTSSDCWNEERGKRQSLIIETRTGARCRAN